MRKIFDFGDFLNLGLDILVIIKFILNTPIKINKSNLKIYKISTLFELIKYLDVPAGGIRALRRQVSKQLTEPSTTGLFRRSQIKVCLPLQSPFSPIHLQLLLIHAQCL